MTWQSRALAVWSDMNMMLRLLHDINNEQVKETKKKICTRIKKYQTDPRDDVTHDLADDIVNDREDNGLLPAFILRQGQETPK